MKTKHPVRFDPARVEESKTPCGSCALSRRKFLAACAACAAGAATLTSCAPETAKRLPIRLAFLHSTPERICWPYTGYDYEGRARRLLTQLKPMCPEVEFLPVHVVSKAQVREVMSQDAEVVGYLMCVLGTTDEGLMLVDLAGKAGRPMVVFEELYAGPHSLGFNGRAAKAGWKAVGLSTSRLEDVAEAVGCFNVLKKPDATVGDFLDAAQAVYRKNIAPMGDLKCFTDTAQVNDAGQSLKALRSSTILLVGSDSGSWGTAIEKTFGVKVILASHATLHQEYLGVDPAQAAEWADRWIEGAEKVVEPEREEIVKSGAMRVAMRQLMKKHDAQAISINCLGGFYSGQLEAYPCLGFVELNNGGLVGGCEGDLASALTMLIGGALAGRPGFISDPVIDTATNQVIYAHCVAPTKVFGPQGPSNPYHIRSHSEDRRGASVRSLMPLGYMTTTLIFNPGERFCLLHQGKSVDNVDDEKGCRTKLAVELKGDIVKLLHTWSNGWHRVTFYGDLKEPFRELCKALGVNLIEEA